MPPLTLTSPSSGYMFRKPKNTPFFKFIAFFFFFFFFMVLLNGVSSTNGRKNTTKIVAIVDIASRMGKEQKMAMQIAAESFNNGNHSFMISLTFMEFNANLLQTALKVATLIKEEKAQVLITSMDNWQATTLIAQVGSQAQVPVLSLAPSHAITPQFGSIQWPFLIQMAHNSTQQIHNLVAIINTYQWRRVIIVSEDDPSNSDYGMPFLLTEALEKVGSKIEYQLLLPPLESTTNPKGAIQEAFANFATETCYSRVFIILRVSLPFISHLFNEAKGRELMGNDSVWILSEHITNLLPSLDKFTMLSMQGALGIMTKFDNSTLSFQEFQAQFGIQFPKEYPQDKDHEPGFHALLAYDAIITITKAIGNISHTSDDATSKQGFLETILQCDFTGLSGRIYFDQDQNALVEPLATRIVNIVGGNYQEIFDFTSEDIEDVDIGKTMENKVTWPGNLNGIVPKGWRMPTEKKLMKIGVPVGHGYKNFVNVLNQSDNCVFKGNVSCQNEHFNGFCIELFRKVVAILNYNLPYEFIPYIDRYEELVHRVHDKSYDAIVADVTILADRTDIVEFTLPFAESGLSIVLPAFESNNRGPWIFLRPFRLEMWLVTLAVLVYTMFIVWFLEHRENADFRGPWRNQLNTAVWFTVSSLYFAQRERISSSLARVVVVTWMFIVLVLTQSYTANLTSMLTTDRLNQTTIDIEMLQRDNVTVGYDNSSFVNKFLEEIFHFNANNIVGIEGGFENFHKKFQAGNIRAAFLDILYAKLFVTLYCNQYTISSPRHRYGGLAYVFPKDSPVAIDVSEAILTLTDNGTLKELEDSWLNTSSECYITDDTVNNVGDQNSLHLKSFWVLFLISVSTTTLCLLASLFPLPPNHWRRMAPVQDNIATNN